MKEQTISRKYIGTNGRCGYFTGQTYELVIDITTVWKNFNRVKKITILRSRENTSFGHGNWCFDSQEEFNTQWEEVQ